jgi:hypothetical protein
MYTLYAALVIELSSGTSIDVNVNLFQLARSGNVSKCFMYGDYVEEIEPLKG